MANIANIVLANGANTPVNITFEPTQKYNGSSTPAVWKAKLGTTPLAWHRVEIHEKKSSRGSRKVSFKVFVPYVTIDASGNPTLVSTALFDSDTGGFTIPPNVMQPQVDDLYAYVKALMALTVVKSWVTLQDAAY